MKAIIRVIIRDAKDEAILKLKREIEKLVEEWEEVEIEVSMSGR